MSKTHYQLLGVEQSANEVDIKKAFYKLAHKHHPDKPEGDAEKFKEINNSYQILSDKDKRSLYDNQLINPHANNGMYQHFYGYESSSTDVAQVKKRSWVFF